MVLSVGSTSQFKNIILESNIISIKVVIVLVILYQLAYKNNSNYFHLLVALYLYLANIKVDSITLLNYLDLFISYPDC